MESIITKNSNSSTCNPKIGSSYSQGSASINIVSKVVRILLEFNIISE